MSGGQERAGSVGAGSANRVIHLDAVGGIAGDMFVAALLDAFPALTGRVLADIAAVVPPEIGEARLEPGFSAGIRCLRFTLHNAPHPHHHEDADHHHGTHFADLAARIAGTSLSPGTAEASVAILTHLAQAEATIHGVALADVHFHEVGDWDSLMDVVAAGSIAAALGPVRWTVSDLPRGSGLVRSQHGLLPIPAPATMQLLHDFGWRDDGIAGERVTPTGAAILRHLCTSSGTAPVARLLAATGTGAGSRDLAGMPNILRVSVFDAGNATGRDTVDILTFDIDDMSGEEVAVAADHLRASADVIDLTLLTLAGKKGRPTCRFEIMARPGTIDDLAALIFAETSTLGFRHRSEQRRILPRIADERDDLRIKTATRPGGERTTKVESDDLAPLRGLARRRATARKAEEPGDGDD
jgi:hypothetical protein